jgi:hypothetical protein
MSLDINFNKSIPSEEIEQKTTIKLVEKNGSKFLEDQYGNVVFFKKDKNGEFDISIVGGALIRGNQNPYIRNFITENTSLIAKYENGVEFLNSMYDTIDKIAEMSMPLGEMCNVGKINAPLEDYLKNKKRISIHKELALIAVSQGRKFSIGDLIYYINVGKEGDNTNIRDYGDKEEFGSIAVRNIENIPFELKGSCKSITKQLETLMKSGLLLTKKISTDPLFGHEITVTEYINQNGWTDYEVKSRKVGNKNKFVLEFSKLELYVEEVMVEDFDSVKKYNAYKYILNFNNSVEQLFVVFDTAVRKNLSYNPLAQHSKDGHKIRPNLKNLDLSLVNGQPLENKMDKQDELNDLMLPDEVEMRLWRELLWHPHFPINGIKLDKDKKYKYFGQGKYEERDNGIGAIELINELGKVLIY